VAVQTNLVFQILDEAIWSLALHFSVVKTGLVSILFQKEIRQSGALFDCFSIGPWFYRHDSRVAVDIETGSAEGTRPGNTSKPRWSMIPVTLVFVTGEEKASFFFVADRIADREGNRGEPNGAEGETEVKLRRNKRG